MKSLLPFLVLCPLMFISCSKDLDDISLSDDDQSGVVDDAEFNLEFQGSDRVIYITGATECTSDGRYSTFSENLVEDLIIPVDLPVFMTYPCICLLYETRVGRGLAFLGPSHII